MTNLTERSHEQELLDIGPTAYTQNEYEECLRQLGRIGHYLGGDKATLKAFESRGAVQTILDVGSGGGQFTLKLGKRFPQAQVTGLDISSEAIDYARKQLHEAAMDNVKFELSESPELSYPPNSFDVVTSTLVCHHMNDDQLIDFLKKSCRIAKDSVIINDLHRHRMTSIVFALISRLFFPNRLICHDGLVSIKRAFTKKEWIKLLNAAEIPLKQCTITWRWAFRWIVCIDTSAKPK